MDSRIDIKFGFRSRNDFLSDRPPRRLHPAVSNAAEISCRTFQVCRSRHVPPDHAGIACNPIYYLNTLYDVRRYEIRAIQK